MKSQWIDVSLSLRNSMVRWPGDPAVKIERVSDRKLGNKYNLSRITMGSHSGTHVDAPLHIIDNGPGVDLMSLDIAIGKARVIEITDRVSIKPEEILKYHLRTGERILFKTTNSSKAWESDKFYKDFVFLSDDAASLLAQRKLRLVGVDYLSVGGFKQDGSKVHNTLLKSGTWIVEGLNLSKVSPGKYDFICLPLKIQDGDGSPARIILRPSK